MTPLEESHRHYCEVRYLIDRRKEKGKFWLLEFLGSVEKKRGLEARQRLEESIKKEWENEKQV